MRYLIFQKLKNTSGIGFNLSIDYRHLNKNQTDEKHEIHLNDTHIMHNFWQLQPVDQKKHCVI